MIKLKNIIKKQKNKYDKIKELQKNGVKFIPFGSGPYLSDNQVDEAYEMWIKANKPKNYEIKYKDLRRV